MRRALFVGINYTYTEFPLRGCHKDVENMHAFFHQRFPEVGEVKVLVDEDGQPADTLPTKNNLLAAMRWLVADAQPGDHFFFHYSGHGGQAKDEDGDEDDGIDETLLPLDYEENGEIHDDELFEILCKNLPKGSVLTAIFDCCHSGTMMDLPYTYLLNQNEEVITVNNFDAASKKLLEGSLAWLNGDKEGAMRAAMESMQMIAEGATVSAQATEEGLAEASQKKKETQGTVIQWSGCKDDQTSADTKIGNMPTGAMSWAFIKTVNENPDCTFLDALKNVRALLRDEYTQIPQVSGRRPLVEVLGTFSSHPYTFPSI
ncbi:peptidase C14, caspase domain-containing protein [Zopfochytrium polystomum]|nr:peptidase C14, caspase domain-containing protein [Zopfochytrium polystomum]